MNKIDDQSDQQWLSDVFASLEVPLVAYATQLLRDPERARDVVQDAFVAICREPRQQIEGHEKAWLYKVCRNRSIDILKKEGRMKTFDQVHEQTQASRVSDPVEVMQQRERAECAGSILEQLPTNQREVIRLKVQGGLSYREISDLTGLSVSNVGFLLHTGLKSIRNRMTQSEQSSVH